MKKKLLTLLILLSINNAFGQRFNTEYSIRKSVKDVPKEWQDLLNPKTTRFWKEGNHIPDEGFLLLAKNPNNKEYAKLWLLRNEIKAKYLAMIQKTVDTAQKELFLEGKLVDRYYQFKDKAKKSKKRNFSPKISSNQLEKLNFYFIYSSTCPHCKKLAKTLTKIPGVLPLQVDNNKLLNFKGLAKSSRASKETLSNYAPDGVVPVVVIHNPKTNSATKITGNKPLDEYLFASSELVKESK